MNHMHQKTIGLLYSAMDSIDGNEPGMDAVIGDIEEALWNVEKLLTAVEFLRTAQRAYMKDRGNDTLGRAVANRARELDEVVAQI